MSLTKKIQHTLNRTENELQNLNLALLHYLKHAQATAPTATYSLIMKTNGLLDYLFMS